MTPEEAAGHNASQPILKLSPEILGQILMHLRTLYPFSASYTTKGTERTGVDLGWVHITHVCRHLRYVALGHSELWSELVCNPGNSRWFSEWLGRSGSVPLSLVLHPLPQGDKSNLQRYQEHLEICRLLVRTPEHLSRLRSVQGDFTRGTLDVLRPLFTRPAPLLEELDIGVLDTPGYCYVIPTPWFASESPPHLNRLVFRDFYLPWATLSLPTLTHLEVRRTVHRAARSDPVVVEHVELAWDGLPANERITQLEVAFAPSTDEFRRCLRSLPLLETLILQNTLPELPLTTTSTDGQVSPKIPMPRLRNLAISHEDSGLCLSFLNALDMPRLEHLTIDINVEPHGELALAQYACLIDYASLYVQQFGLPIGALGIDMEDLRSTVRVALPDSSTHLRSKDISPTFREVLAMSVSVGDMTVRGHNQEPLLTLLRALPLQTLHSLSLTGAFQHGTILQTTASSIYMCHSLWRPIFHLCSAAQVVQAANMAVMPLVAHLNAYKSVSGMPRWVLELDEEVAGRMPVFPHLRELSLLQPTGDPQCAGFVFEMLTFEWGLDWEGYCRMNGWEGSQDSLASERRSYGPELEEHASVRKRARSYKFVRILKDCLKSHRACYYPDCGDGPPPLEYLRVDVGYEEAGVPMENMTVLEYADLLKGVAKEVVVVKVNDEGLPATSVTARVSRR